jgi:hypothetical protein
MTMLFWVVRPRKLADTSPHGVTIQNNIVTFTTFRTSNLTYNHNFKVLTAVKMSMLVIWVATPCELVERYQSFGGKYSLHFQGGRRHPRRQRQYVPQNRCYVPTSPHVVVTQQTNIGNHNHS